MANQVLLSVDYIPNPSIGKALSLANIYVGIVDLDPKIVGNQKQISVLQENGTTVEVSQPISTSAGGVPLYNGSPVTILVDGSYSLRIDDSTDTQVYYVPKNAELEALSSFDTIGDMKAITETPANGDVFNVLGYSAATENRGWEYQWVAASTDSGNGGSIIELDSAPATGRFFALGDITVNHFGDDFQAALDWAASKNDIPIIYIEPGGYNLNTTSILVPTGASLIGKGETQISTGTTANNSSVIIEYGGTGAAFKIGNGVINGRGIKLANFALEGNDVGVEGINFFGTIASPSIGNIIENVNISGFTNYGIRGQEACWSNSLINVGVHDCGIAQISLDENCNAWTIANPDISTTIASTTADGIVWDGDPGTPSIGCTIVGGAIQNLRYGIVTVNSFNVTVLGTYFEGNQLAFDAGGGGPFTVVGSNITARSGEDYTAKVSSGGVSITGVGVFGSNVVADFNLAGGYGVIEIARNGSTAPDAFAHTAGLLDSMWRLSNPANKTVMTRGDRQSFQFTKADAQLVVYDVSDNEMLKVTPLGAETSNIGIGRAVADAGAGIDFQGIGFARIVRDGGTCMNVNRLTSDGDLVNFQQDSITEGTISVAGNVVTYGTFNGSHWSSIDADVELLVGTILSSISELYKRKDYLPNVTVSNIVGDKSVYGVFLGNKDMAELTPIPGKKDILVSALGAGSIRVSKYEVVNIGDYLISNGDGTACVQTDDILRSSTVAKVTSTVKLEVYPDGSYLVPCTLHCG